MNKEIWKDIPGYDNKYQVSNFGNVRSVKRKKNLRLFKNNNGYMNVVLYKNSRKKHWRVHRLVAMTFLENVNQHPVVNHIDENKSNNFVENLEWCTHKYNTNYGNAISKRTRNSTKKVYQFTRSGHFIKVWDSATQASEVMNISNKGISQCCNKNKKSYKNYLWSFEGGVI